jgi:hypothetical protein
MPAVKKYFNSGAKRATIELWRAKVPQRDIMKQVGMMKTTLVRVLAFAGVNPADPIAHPTKLSVQGAKSKIGHSFCPYVFGTHQF